MPALSALLGSALKLDLDSDNPGITIATGVDLWPDQSGQGNDVTQGTGAAQPSLVANVFNGHRAVRFNGSQFLNRLSFAGVVAGDRPRLYCVCSFTGSGSYTGALFSLGNTAALNQGTYLNHFTNNGGYLARRNGTFRYASGATQGGASSVPALYDGRNETSDVVFAVNNADVATAAVGAATGLDLTPDRISVGILEDLATQPLTGDLFRCLVVNPSTPATHATVLSYLRATYPSLPI